MTLAYIAGLTLGIEDTGTPGTYNTLEETKSVGGLGVTNDLVEVTNFDSNKVKEYIAALSDGAEVSIECNHILDPAGNAVQQQLIQHVLAKETINVRFSFTDGTNTEDIDVQVVSLSYTITPAVDDATTLAFSVKLTG